MLHVFVGMHRQGEVLDFEIELNLSFSCPRI